MKKIEVTIGFKYVDDNGNVVKIESDFSNNGYCYKDLSAWEKNEGIIYAPEYAFEDAEDENGCFIEGDELKEQWTRESWENYVRGIVFHHCYEEIATLSFEEKEKLIDYIAYNILCMCDWQDLSTYIEEWDWEDCIEELIEEIRAKNRKVWCVQIHIVSDYETITDDVRLFDVLGNAKFFFNKIVDEEREIANDNEFVIECDDSCNFVAYEEGYYARNHICINLFEKEIE